MYSSNSISFSSLFSNHSGFCRLCIDIKPVLINDSSHKVQIHHLVKESGQYNLENCRILVNLKFDIDFMRRMLRGYNDLLVLDLLKYGFPIGCTSRISHFSSVHRYKPKNHLGAEKFPVDIHNYLVKESSHEAIMGPFKRNPFLEPLKLSPLNYVPKSDHSERIVILDLSYQKNGVSVNNLVDNYYLGEKCDLIFPKIDDFISLILSKGSLIFKLDLCGAYRQISICPSDCNLVPFRWQNHIFCDTDLTMRLRSSSQICQRVTNAFSYMFRNVGLAVLNCLDDFGGVEKPDLACFAFKYS